MQTLPMSILTSSQKITKSRTIGRETLVAEIRHDDDCGNGHNSFAITADLYKKAGNGRKVWLGGGCIHDEVARFFPELAPYLKWHLCSTDSPRYYVTNTVYFASNRDHWGLLKGEPKSFNTFLQFEASPGTYFPITFKVNKRFANFLAEYRYGSTDLSIATVAHSPGSYAFEPQYTFAALTPCAWHECLFATRQQAEEMQAALSWYKFELIHIPTAWGEGKEPDIDAARSCAIWPDATLEQLQDKAALAARLPALMQEFKTAVESLGLVY